MWSFNTIPVPFNMAYSPDGTLVAIAGQLNGRWPLDGGVQIWNVATGTMVRELALSGISVYSVAFSPDGTKLVVGSDSLSFNGALSLWSVATGQLIEKFAVGSDAQVYSVAFSPDGDTIAAGGGHDTTSTVPYLLQLWSASSGALLQDMNPGTSLKVDSVAFSPDGTKLAAAGYISSTFSSTGILTLWNVSTGTVVYTSSDGVGISSVAFSPDGTTLAAAEANYVNNAYVGVLNLWNAATGKITSSLPTLATNSVNTVAYSLDGKTLANSGTTKTGALVEVWSISSGSYTRTVSANGVMEYCQSFALAPDASTFMVGGQFENPNTGVSWPVLEQHNGKTGALNTQFSNTGTHVMGTALSPDGKTLAIGGYRGTSGNNVGVLELWNSVTGVRLKALDATAFQEIHTLNYSSDAKSLAVGGIGSNGLGALKQISTSSGAALQSFPTASTAVDAVAFSPKGDKIADGGTQNRSGVLELWATATAKPVVTLASAATTYVRSVQFSLDGTMLADAGGELQSSTGNVLPIVEVWAVPSGKSLLSFLTPAGVPSTPCIAFSPNGKNLAAGSGADENGSGEVDVWRLSDFAHIQSVATTTDHGFNAMAYTPDGKYLIGNMAMSVDLMNTTNFGLTSYYDHGLDDRGSVSVTPDSSIFCYTADGGVVAAVNPYATYPAVTGLTLSPTQVTGGLTFTGKVTLASTAPLSGMAVTLKSGSKVCVLPASVTVTGGATTATFNGATVAVSGTASVTLSATGGGKTVSTTLKVVPPSVSKITLAPGTVLGGTPTTATVTLNAVAPSGGTVVTLSGSSSSVSAPSTVKIQAGSISGTATINTKPVATKTTATILASAGSASASASLTIQPPTLIAVSASPNPVAGGQSATGTLTLNGPAPTGGIVVQVSSSNTAIATCAASATIPAGSTTKTFWISTHKETAQASVTLTASTSVKLTTNLIVQPAVITGLALSASSVSGGQMLTGTLTLSAPALSTITIKLTSSNAAIGVPSSVTVAAGASSATFDVTTSKPASGSILVTVTGKLYASTATAQVAVTQ
jgi:WD40 repeat protein